MTSAGHPHLHGWTGAPYLALPTPGAVHGCIQLGVTGGPHGAPECVTDILQEERTGHTCPSQGHHSPCPLAPPKVPWALLQGPLLSSVDDMARGGPEPRGSLQPTYTSHLERPQWKPWGLGDMPVAITMVAFLRTPQGRLTSQNPALGEGGWPTGPHTHVHAVAKGRVGSVLEATLVADVVEDARRHRGEVDDILGGSVVQAHTPATAAEMEHQDGVRSHLCPGARAAAWATCQECLNGPGGQGWEEAKRPNLREIYSLLAPPTNPVTPPSHLPGTPVQLNNHRPVAGLVTSCPLPYNALLTPLR